MLYVMNGGPYNLQKLFLSSPGTAVFTVGAWSGFYDKGNTWVSGCSNCGHAFAPVK